MDEKDLPSSSDESDADFVPKEEDNSGSGSEVSDCVGSDEEDELKKGKKRKKKTRKLSKKVKVNKNEEEEEEEGKGEEKSKIDVDALWTDFKKDVDSKDKKKTADTKPEAEPSVTNHQNSDQNKPIVNKTRTIPNFPNRGRGGGLSSVLNQIGKKDKMSTLKKSQLDWNNFKKSEGIEEEIKQHNRGKDGYLERQDFLQRTDLRQFEIEKDLRSARRKF
ncbi:hypothetical protein RUM44_008574 [Polyplax serrata]|uniref:Craniofacial development protein 1 n=1 Tax=Polyplax serrata TaxID=468196 RepID=A0ABR1B8P3_POLSC